MSSENTYFRYIRTSEPGADVVSDTELKAHLRIDHSDEDSIITSINKAATRAAEDYCNRSFINQTWKAYLRCFPSKRILLPRGRVSSITGIDYAVNAAHDTEWSSSEYITALETDIGIIEPVDSWPDTDTDYPNGIEIEYVAGYGAAGSNVPNGIHQGIMILAADLYEMRRTHSDKALYETKYLDLPLWQRILDPFKIYL